MGPLAGIPLAHKDEFYTKDILTTCGSSILSEFVPDFDATPIARFHEAGAVMLGKLNMTEFASPVTWVFPYGQPRNPWNLEHDAGGSSTGSGIAVAAALCAGSLAEDTGGSIRRPASCNGAVGIRPTLGRVSTHGMIASSWNQDTAGPIARSVADCALLLEAVAGFDANDLMSARLLGALILLVARRRYPRDARRGHQGGDRRTAPGPAHPPAGARRRGRAAVARRGGRGGVRCRSSR